jgi:hypothetical protein
MLLHAYPINDMYQHCEREGGEKPHGMEKPNLKYVKKLEYSSDKVKMSAHKRKRSAEKQAKKDKSMEVADRGRDYFQIHKRDRKNTLSGHK